VEVDARIESSSALSEIGEDEWTTVVVMFCLILSCHFAFPSVRFPLLVLLGSFPFFSLPPSLSSLYRSVPAPSCSYSPTQSSSLFTPVPYLAL
jgi:hypothetical protein